MTITVGAMVTGHLQVDRAIRPAVGKPVLEKPTTGTM